MDTIVIFLIDHFFLWLFLACIGYVIYSYKKRDRILPPKFKVHQKVIAQDFKWGEGELKKCRVIHIQTNWTPKDRPEFTYYLIIEESGYPLTVPERFIQSIEQPKKFKPI